jgi:hypothetical protein
MRSPLLLLLSLFVAGTTWLYVHRTLEPWTNYIHAGEGTTQMGDLYSPWMGTRELLLYRHNPYSPEVSHKIQMAFYGHVIDQKYGAGIVPINEQRFAYPIYVVFLLAPTVYADFADVHRWAPVALALLTAIGVILCLHMLVWRPPLQIALALILFTLSSPQIVQGLRLEQLAVVVGFLLIAGAWCINQNHVSMAGVFLALSSIKPQMALVPLCWFAIWTLGCWPKRWRLAAAFVGTLAALTVAGEFLRPGWLGFFLAGLAAYREYFPTTSLLRLALGDTLGEILGGVIVIGLLTFGWRNRKEAGNAPRFASVLAVFFAGAILAFPLLAPFNQVMLILPAMLVLRDWKALPRLSRIVFFVAVSWPWIVSWVLLLLPPRVDSPSQLPLLPSILVPFVPLLLFLLLMGRRAMPVEASLPAMELPPASL